MPRIGIDARISRSWSSGVGVYTVRLLEALSRVAPWHHYLLITTAQAPPVPLPAGSLIDQRTMPFAVGGPGQLLRLPQAMRRLGLDVLVVNHPASASLWSHCPQLIFVHDLIPLALPRSYSAAKRFYYRSVVRWSLRRATRVLVDSDSTRRDCQRLLGVPRDAMRVVYGGVSDRYHGANGQSSGLGVRPYVLYVGNKRPHKNVARLIEAFRLLLSDRDPGCDLVIAGRDEPGDIETDARGVRLLADELGLNGRVRFVGEVPEEDLPALYRGAEAFIYLSSYEGFGLPPLEAMACGTPVVALKATSLPEVVGDGGLLLDSADPAIVADSVRRVLADRTLRDSLSQRAVRQARRFSWEATASCVSEEIDAALKGSSTL